MLRLVECLVPTFACLCFTLPYVMLSVYPLDIHWIAVAAYIANNFTRTCAARADPHWQICVHTILFISSHRRYGHISRIEQTHEHENARACICCYCSTDCVAFQTISVHEIAVSLIVGFAFTQICSQSSESNLLNYKKLLDHRQWPRHCKSNIW